MIKRYTSSSSEFWVKLWFKASNLFWGNTEEQGINTKGCFYLTILGFKSLRRPNVVYAYMSQNRPGQGPARGPHAADKHLNVSCEHFYSLIKHHKMLLICKLADSRPFSLKVKSNMVLILARIDHFCFQCGPRAKKELPTSGL